MDMNLYGLYAWKDTSQVLVGIKRLQTHQEGLRNRVIKSFPARKMNSGYQTREVLLKQRQC